MESGLFGAEHICRNCYFYYRGCHGKVGDTDSCPQFREADEAR